MKTVTALFDTYAQAEEAVTALKAAGIAEDHISLIARDGDRFPAHTDDVLPEDLTVGIGSGVGLIAGGTSGLLAGLGMITIPGVGAAVAAGWLVSLAAGAATGALVGGATGSLIAALTNSNISENDAHVYAESVRRGGSLVLARVHDDRAQEAEALLASFAPIDIHARRQALLDEGWEQFEEPLPPDAEPEPVPPEEYLEERRREHGTV